MNTTPHTLTPEELRERTTLTVPEAARVILGPEASEAAAYRLARAGHIPGLRQVGVRKFVSAPVLLAWLTEEGAA